MVGRKPEFLCVPGSALKGVSGVCIAPIGLAPGWVESSTRCPFESSVFLARKASLESWFCRRGKPNSWVRVHAATCKAGSVRQVVRLAGQVRKVSISKPPATGETPRQGRF